jgi:hypothetical protein
MQHKRGWRKTTLLLWRHGDGVWWFDMLTTGSPPRGAAVSRGFVHGPTVMETVALQSLVAASLSQQRIR